MDRKKFLTLSAAAVAAATLCGPFGRQKEALAATSYADALTNKILSEIKAFKAWAGSENLFIGEVEIPSNLGQHRSKFTDQSKWAALGETYLGYTDSQGIVCTFQEASEQYYDIGNGGYYASVYLCPGDKTHKAVSKPGNSAPTIEASTLGDGINFSGGQKFSEGPMSNANPGVYDKDYWYPTTGSNPVVNGMNSFQYLASRGIRRVRIGFRWERIQPQLMGPLDPTDLARLKTSVANANAAGLKVVLDLHNYGGYVTSAGRQKIGSPGCPLAAFVDVWKRLSASFAGQCEMYDLMNEPYNHGGVASGSFPSPEKAWESYTQAVVNGIRSLGDATELMIPTYANVKGTPRKHAGPWIKDSGLHSYGAHHYFDDDGGHFDYDYATYNRQAANQLATKITSGPSGAVRSTSAKFGFASGVGTAFQCSIDGAAYRDCTSTQSYTNLSNAKHTFRVTATDGAGNANGTPAARTWTADTIKPVITGIHPRPGSRTRDNSPRIKATIKDNLTSLKKSNIRLYVSGKLVPASKYRYSSSGLLVYNSPKLPNGKKKVKIVARDAAGNVSVRSWHFKIK